MNKKLYRKFVISKTAFLFYFLAILSVSVTAQDSVVITGGSNVKLLNGTPMFIDGSIIIEDGGITNSGDIFLKGNILNNAIDSVFGETEQGLIRFVGDSIQRIYGNPVRLNKIFMQKVDSSLCLGTNLAVKDTIFFGNGIIDLNGYDVYLNNSDLASFGTLGAESDSSRVTGQSGYVYTIASITDFINKTGMGMGMHFSGSGTGNVRVERGHTSQITVTDGSIKKYYNVFATNSGQNMGVEVYYMDSTDFWDINCTEKDFRLFTSYTQGYYFENKYGEVDTALNKANTLVSDNLNLHSDTRITVADHICDNPPIVNIGDTMRICAGSTAYLNAENTGNYFYWSTGQTSQTIPVTNAGWYYVTVTDPYRCFSIDSIIVVHDSLPHPDFDLVGGVFNCPGEEYNFINNTNSDPSTLPITYLWEFGDGSSSTDFEPVKSYLSPGTYAVTLTVNTNANCHSAFSKNLIVHPLPDVSFSYNNVCDYNPVIVDNTTANVNFCTWDFGDGTVVNCTNPNIDTVHQYLAFGSYPIQLTVSSSLGCVDSLTQTVNVYPSPVAGFTTDDANVCLQDPSIFHNTSTSQEGTLTYLWNFGNGMTNSTPNPIISYANSGDFDVSLIALSEYGCSDTIQHIININPLPIASFTYNDVCLGDTVHFVNGSSISGIENLNYNWSFGDGTSSTLENVDKVYATEGTFTVILNVTSESGCVGYIEHNIHVYPLPSVDFVCQPVCNGNASLFNNYSSTGLGTLSYSWDFGDGNNSTALNPEHVYGSDGTYQAELVALTQYGCSDTLIKPVIVKPVPSVDIGDEIHHCFNTLVLDAGNPSCTYHWSNNAASQSVTVNTSGYYSVTVTNADNCSESDTVHVLLNVPVVVDLGGDYLETCDSIILDADYPGATYLWTFDGTEVSSNQTLTVYESGNYSVDIDYQGCPGDTTVFVQVYQSPVINLGDDITECEGINVELSQSLVFPDYLWSTNETSASIIVNDEGTYSLTVTDDNGCTANDEIIVNFNNLPVFPFGADTIVCGNIMLDAQNPGSTYLWNNSSVSQTVFVDQTGEYSVTITGGNSCIISDTVNVTVNPLPDIYLGNDTALCVGEIYVLHAGEGFESYLWNDLSNAENMSVVETGNYFVEVGNSYDCYSTDSIYVSFNSNPEVNLGENQYLCSNQIAVIDAGDDGDSYLWGSSGDFSSTETSVMVADSGMYWVQVTNGFGCTSRDSVLIQYSESSLTAYFLAASEAKRGDTVRFVDVSFPEPDNYLWSFGDGETSQDAIPSHVYYIEGTFQVVLAASNNYCMDTISKLISISGTKKTFIPLDVQEAPSESLIEIVSSDLYPNPTKNECYYELQLNRQTLIILDLYDMGGRILYSEHIDNASYVFKTLELGALQPGMYFLRMRYSNKSETYKIIKQ
ncbi:MAG: PKD domain-containing protein [Bacteroidales bacterium]|nr:PKD domain-containing protein [Bacteroidales bacterium]